MEQLWKNSLLLALVAIVGCESGTKKSRSPEALNTWLEQQEHERNEESGTSERSDAGSAVDADPEAERCTLADDNQPCETGNETGFTKCVASRLECWVCHPGETRTANCGCDVDREDLCNDSGRWRKGACDGCSEDPAEVPCGFCGEEDPASGECVGGGECMPGWVRFQRCDSCPDPSGCNPSSCVGEKWECNQSCSWVKTEGCDLRPSQCDGERDKVEPCGVCGNVRAPCDGCFWDYPLECDEEQECYPGTSRIVDCFGNGCREGYRSTITCGNDCRFASPTRCVGCTEGWHNEERNCVYRHPNCGKETIEYYCTVPAPNGTCDVPLGTKGSFSTLTPCPPIDCYPGQQRAQGCMTDQGTGGQQTKRCQNDCTWPESWTPCGGTSSSCVPGEEEVSTVNCGCGVTYERVRSCNSSGTGWTTHERGQEDCPPCKSGESEDRGCSSSSTCGSQTRSCTSQCQWGDWSTCDQASWACYNGDTKQGSCRGTCGGGSATFSCSNCRWVQSSACYPDNEPQCTPGELRQEACRTDIPGCPLREDFCSSSCQWVEGTCPPCD